MKKFPICIQHDIMDCGAVCVKMITDYHKMSHSLEEIKEICSPTREGVSLSGVANTFDYFGFSTIGGKLNLKRLLEKAPLPCILHWNQEHFVVLYKIKKKRGKTRFYIADPGIGLISYSEEEFKENWYSTKSNESEKGVILLVEKKAKIEKKENDKKTNNGFIELAPYFFKYKKYFFLLFIGLFIGSFIQLVLPFLTKSIVDIGIKDENIKPVVHLAQIHFNFVQISLEYEKIEILNHGKRSDF